MRITLTTVVLFVLCFCSALTAIASDETPTARRIYETNAEAVVLLYAQSANGEFTAQGSGFLIAGGDIVTNAHVANAGKIFIDVGSARLPTRVKRVDNFNDLAVLGTDAQLSAQPVQLGNDIPAAGDVVYVIANPKGLERTISQGLVSGIREFSGRKLLQISAPISSGSSGGPIFDERGMVVGVAVGVLREGQNLNFAVPISLLHRLLKFDSAPEKDATALLREINSLIESQQEDEWSHEVDSPYQKKQAQINYLLNSTLEVAANDPDMLLRLSTVALWNDDDVALSAAQKAKQLRNSAESNRAVAEALWRKSLIEAGEQQRSRLKDAERHARLALTLVKVPSGGLYYTLGHILESQKSYPEADKVLRMAFASPQATTDSELKLKILRALISCSDELHKSEDAIRFFQALVETGEVWSFDWRRQAARLYNLKQYIGAGRAYQNAAENGGTWQDWCKSTIAYSRGNMDDETLASARKCVELGVGEKDSADLLAIAHTDIAEVLLRRGVYSEALAHAKEATSLTPSSAWSYDLLSQALLALRRFQEAINAASQAVRLSDGKYASVHFHLGSAYYEVENWEFARQSFEMAAKLDPSDAAPAYNVALCYQKLRYFRDAAIWYEEYLRRRPDAKDRNDVLQTIRILRER